MGILDCSSVEAHSFFMDQGLVVLRWMLEMARQVRKGKKEVCRNSGGFNFGSSLLLHCSNINNEIDPWIVIVA